MSDQTVIEPAPSAMLRPTTEDGVRDAVAWAISERAPLEIVGHGSRRAIGRPMQTAETLSLADLSGVTLYEPEELVLSARAGTPLADLSTLLAERGQQFQFEPMDYGPLLAEPPGVGTLGGMAASNLSGPRRLKAGAARDHVLGMRFVTGRGDIVKAGGRVVKNVTGYDLSKGLCGSWGTLGAMTEVTMKVMPRPETEATLVLSGLDDGEATEAMAVAMGSSAEVASAAHLPESVKGRFLDKALAASSTVLRLEGFAPSVEYRFSRLAALLKPFGPAERLDGDESQRLWREIRDVEPFCDGTARPVWRVAVAPSVGHQLVGALRLRVGVDAFYDWQGGLVWLRMEAEPGAELLRATIRALGGGHATLIRASREDRASIPVFEPQPAPLAALAGRLKAQFDPHGILNPGRMASTY
ncbi:glycolate oxidase subunit GlcE [Pararhizobium haloflavum]|uniref:glycolate oxidase subunit GlcE n=1 Tax=Pararhizobium haloflavum TaxID=2037914 RepID=UPI000C19F93A|nr:glycolate oxidase subunit GlcE [Pararhizobium haloflavum]